MNTKKFALFPLLFILILDAMGFGLVLPVLRALLIDPNTSLLASTTSTMTREIFVGLTLAVFPLAVAIGTPILGIWSDRVGRKAVLSTCLIGGFLGLAICAISVYFKSIELLLIGRFLTGFTSASQPIAQAAAIDMSTPDNKPINLSLIAFAMTVGMALGPLLGGILSDIHLLANTNLAIPFWVASGLSLINLVCLVFIFHEKRDLYQQTQAWSFSQYSQKAVVLFRNPAIRQLLYSFVLLEICWSLYFQAVPLILMRQFAYDSAQIGMFITFLGLSMCFGLIVIFRLWIRAQGLSQIIRSCFLLGSLALLSCIVVPSKIWQWVGIIPFTLAVGIAYTSIISLISSAVDTHLQGWAVGFTACLLALSWSLTGLIAGWFVANGLFSTLITCLLIFAIAAGINYFSCLVGEKVEN